MREIDLDLLRRPVSLDAETGKLTFLERTPDMFPVDGRQSAEWRCRRWNSRHAGTLALDNDKDGYRVGYLLGVAMSAHRVVFALHHGRWPKGLIDHENHVRSDNRPNNLREASNQENSRNSRRSRRNTSGVSGVVWNKAEGRWKARINADTGRVHLGTFDHFHEAVDARKAAEARLNYHPNHGES